MTTNGRPNGSVSPERSEPETARERARRAEYEPPLGDSSRKPGSERENAFQALAWALEGATGILEELRRSDFGLSEDFWVHAYAARREGLLAMRAAIDTLIEKSTAAEVAEQERQKRRDRRGGIDIEF